MFDLLLAQYGVRRDGLPGEWSTGYEDASQPYTPAWQEGVTSVPADAVVRLAREFAHTAEKTRGRCVIVMGAGTNHWFHSDTIYRAFLGLLMLTGCQGVNGSGWAHAPPGSAARGRPLLDTGALPPGHRRVTAGSRAPGGCRPGRCP
ncbi:hypothetical protein GCM10010145_02680 [Streptomyces ruber]|uniref:Molybdopterin oxidoreductase domain-containing protein n=2 Tax=Streptomyces TaxID=1883 RepID=A0A918B6E2_9ACTN|nr:hypothetical protein GCM10010145_02680 [Streptomyces ruber]